MSHSGRPCRSRGSCPPRDEATRSSPRVLASTSASRAWSCPHHSPGGWTRQALGQRGPHGPGLSNTLQGPLVRETAPDPRGCALWGRGACSGGCSFKLEATGPRLKWLGRTPPPRTLVCHPGGSPVWSGSHARDGPEPDLGAGAQWKVLAARLGVGLQQLSSQGHAGCTGLGAAVPAPTRLHCGWVGCLSVGIVANSPGNLAGWGSGHGVQISWSGLRCSHHR